MTSRPSATRRRRGSPSISKRRDRSRRPSTRPAGPAAGARAKAPPPPGNGLGRYLLAVRAVHPFPSLLVALVTVGIVFIADQSPPPSAVARLGLGMLCLQFAIGLANDVADREADARSKPWKPVASGVLPPRTATFLAAAFSGLGLVVTASFGTGPWLVGVAGLHCGLLYDLFLKRTVLSWLPMVLAFPLIPVWVFGALDRWEPLLWWVFPIGGLLGLAVHLANQHPDIAADRRAGVRGIAQRAGGRAAFAISIGALGAGLSIGAVVLVATGHAPQAALVGLTGVVALSLAPRAARFFGRDGLFGTVAVSSALSAGAFLSAV